MYRWIKSSSDVDMLPGDQYDAIHEYQQTSFERLTTCQLSALQEYIKQSTDVTEELYRGMQVPEDVLNNWIDKGRIVFSQITSWTTDGAVAARFSTVRRYVDAEDGMRSVILVAQTV